MVRLSRRKIAAYAATQLAAGEKPHQVIKKLAAYLIETGRTKEVRLLVRDIEYALSERSVVIVDVMSAHQLSASIKTELQKMVGGKHTFFREKIDTSVLGGARIGIPGKQFDGTIRHKLALLKAKQL